MILYTLILVSYKRFLKYQSLIEYIEKNLGCDLNSEMDPGKFNILSNYVKGLKIDYVIPNERNSKRIFKANGLLESAAEFL